MARIADILLRHRRTVLIATVLITLASAALALVMKINFNLSDYLPENAPSTKSLKVLNESFAQGIPNLNVYLPVDGVPEALEYKQRLRSLDGVRDVLWLDDVADIMQPLEFLDSETVSSWYKDGAALYMVTADSGRSVEIAEAVRKIIGQGGAISGEIANFAYIQTVTMGEVSKIMLYVVPLVLLVLFLTTSSWFEPVLFLIVIGIAIIVNEGTNIILGEISYVTRATSAILQLAVSMDYAVFLLHSFARHRREGSLDVMDAIRAAMIEASPAIAASMLTTLFGFLALILMKFKIGPDMGLVLAKGVLLSFISVALLLPVLVVYTAKLMDKTTHRSFMPSFDGFARFIVRVCIPITVVCVLIMGPCFLAQRNNRFIYGSSSMNGEDSSIKQEANYIEEKFGKNRQMVLLVPAGEPAMEKKLCERLKEIPSVRTVVSYSESVGVQIPEQILDPAQLETFQSGGYGRIIFYCDTPEEGEQAFGVVDMVRSAAESVFGENYELIGQSVVNYDLRDTVRGDNLTVTFAAIISIGLVLLITFKSISIPLILLLTIEGAIWINLSIPYFLGNNLNFIGYQIISSVQLGATVDYGILMTQNYLGLRTKSDKRAAAIKAVSSTAPSVLTPALLLFTSGMILGIVSTNGVISELGIIIGRGALISVGMVLLFLPALFIIFDGAIQKTTFKRKRASGGNGE